MRLGLQVAKPWLYWRTQVTWICCRFQSPTAVCLCRLCPSKYHTYQFIKKCASCVKNACQRTANIRRVLHYDRTHQLGWI